MLQWGELFYNRVKDSEQTNHGAEINDTSYESQADFLWGMSIYDVRL